MTQEEKIALITTAIGLQFRCYGGGGGSSPSVASNPIAAALKDEPLIFATGADVATVVKCILLHKEFLDACQVSPQGLNMDTVTISKELLQTLLDAAAAGISIREDDADDSGAEPEDTAIWAAEAKLWQEAVTQAIALLSN